MGLIHPGQYRPLLRKPAWYRPLAGLLKRVDLELVRPAHFDVARRLEGKDWPVNAESMLSRQRLDNIRFCLESVLRDNVPGDIIEAGTWLGGAAIFMRAVLQAHDIKNRSVWVADSFGGLPPADTVKYPQDTGDTHSTFLDLIAPFEAVQENFRKYGLLDSQVKFLPGWFSETLEQAPIDRLAVARLDGDMYGSTIESLNALYPKLSAGGYCIIDDYNLSGARQATDDYRAAQGISESLVKIDWTGVYWRKER
ncbi:MAG: TylF/MycF family methyltransferase [Acidobacteriia bacterium]|nr:TylF/MycF family methyltransferase [Terriglobia bacterium]